MIVRTQNCRKLHPRPSIHQSFSRTSPTSIYFEVSAYHRTGFTPTWYGGSLDDADKPRVKQTKLLYPLMYTSVLLPSHFVHATHMLTAFTPISFTSYNKAAFGGTPRLGMPCAP